MKPDPLHAAVEALFHAVVTYGRGYPVLLVKVRQAFPELDRGR